MYQLTNDEKKYLNRMCNFLKSFSDDLHEVELTEWHDYDSQDYLIKELRNVVSGRNYFDGRHRVDVTEGFKNIVDNILNNIDGWDEPDTYEIKSVTSNIRFNCFEKKISIYLIYYFYDHENTSDIYEKEPEIVERLESEGFNLDQSTIYVDYSGGGDSGWLENIFNNGEEVPRFFEDWCYGKLNSDYSGWELDEGSSGSFIVNFEKKTIEIVHSANTETSEEYLIYQTKF
jgi:hypothetical protein